MVRPRLVCRRPLRAVDLIPGARLLDDAVTQSYARVDADLTARHRGRCCSSGRAGCGTR